MKSQRCSLSCRVNLIIVRPVPPQLEVLEEERIQAALEVEIQRKVVLKASQDVSSLDKLEEKQLEDYHYLEARNNEKEIVEHVITRLAYAREGLN